MCEELVYFMMLCVDNGMCMCTCVQGRQDWQALFVALVVWKVCVVYRKGNNGSTMFVALVWTAVYRAGNGNS